MNRSVLAVAAAGLLLASPAAAQVVELDEVLVTAGRTAAPARSVGRAHTIVEGEALERDQVREVSDALRRVPGVSVSRSGSFGGFTQVRLRGAEASHVLVLIDGVRANRGSDGGYDFGGLLGGDIERIEVLRGPQSAFFGSQALAGVINIITKGGLREGLEVRATAEGGAFGTGYGHLSARGGGAGYDFAVSGSARSTQGIDLSRFGRERDGDVNGTLNGRLTVDLADGLTLDGSFRLVHRRNELDGTDFATGLPVDAQEETRVRDLVGGLGLTAVSPDGALTQRLRLSGNDATLRAFAEGERNGEGGGSKGRRVGALYQASHAFDGPAGASHVVTGGYEFERESFRQLEPVFDPSQLDTQSRDMHALVGEYRGTFLDQFHLTGAVRQDFNDAFEDAATYSLSGAWVLPGRETRLHASLGTGVQNPNFYDQFGFIPGSFAGNPQLRPEKSFGWDIGVEQGFLGRALVVDATYFDQDLENEIVTLFLPDFTSTPVNEEGRSRRRGVELAATLDLGNGFSAGASYTYTDASDPEGEREVRRPRHAGSLSAAYVFDEERARLFTDIAFNGRMEDDAFGSAGARRVGLGSYTLVTLGGSYRFTEHLEGFARVENLLGEAYEEVYGYSAPGRGAFAGLNARF
ncbi:TonB-dependent receptor plug domain-containing protein [Aureimonas populi]|uniref:TonB-dependent receptor plug domain-containing protein n=1 Tax=Aureimonas populi TaxID=1701758 RepID=A0ABW5CJH0_9HYPH|nr:TonB-dependent receptor [Aureimonas populi]